MAYMVRSYDVSFEVKVRTLLIMKDTEFMTGVQIAEQIGYSRASVDAVVRTLKYYKLVETKKGPGGGFKLTKAKNQYLVGEILPLLGGNNQILRNALKIIREHPLISLVEPSLP